MNKKKMLTAILATAMLTLTSVAVASEVVNETPSQQSSVSTITNDAVQDLVHIRTKNIDETIFYPMDAIFIKDVTHTGATAFNSSFTTGKGNGDQLNIWVRNNASSPVYVNIKRDGSEFYNYKLNGGAQQTFNFVQDIPAGGITGNWEVYVYNSDGARYNLNINARQF
ncbi:hypothetical protein [Paenibacillus donghaensis]|uniref:Uncharacterized protein n=1 Tax=Paenibacillus donghaensis TaxID=414771 RepID=A0A2Z2KLG5_9BACL|nr:hypothetical protein [Paenibacillus donghaensis]ASA21902.1 hypothetical protein B9T62_14625 [Paenibacillus donghaensis]